MSVPSPADRCEQEADIPETHWTGLPCLSLQERERDVHDVGVDKPGKSPVAAAYRHAAATLTLPIVSLPILAKAQRSSCPNHTSFHRQKSQLIKSRTKHHHHDDEQLATCRELDGRIPTAIHLPVLTALGTPTSRYPSNRFLDTLPTIMTHWAAITPVGRPLSRVIKITKGTSHGQGKGPRGREMGKKVEK